jgi:antitoxin HicB
MQYPLKVHKEKDGGCWLSFPDIPRCYTNGDSVEDAMKHALDAIETGLDYYFDNYVPIPLPSPAKRGQKFIELPPPVAAKVLLHNEMVRQKVRPIDLARKMGIPRQELTRVLNLKHNTKIETTARALAALGKRLELRVA